MVRKVISAWKPTMLFTIFFYLNPSTVVITCLIKMKSFKRDSTANTNTNIVEGTTSLYSVTNSLFERIFANKKGGI